LLLQLGALGLGSLSHCRAITIEALIEDKAKDIS